MRDEADRRALPFGKGADTLKESEEVLIARGRARGRPMTEAHVSSLGVCCFGSCERGVTHELVYLCGANEEVCSACESQYDGWGSREGCGYEIGFSYCCGGVRAAVTGIGMILM